MKKIFAILLAVTAFGVVMSGCQQGGGEGDAAKPAEGTEKPTEGAAGS